MRNPLYNNGILTLSVLITVLAEALSGRGVFADDVNMNSTSHLSDLHHHKEAAELLRVQRIKNGKAAKSYFSRISHPSIAHIEVSEGCDGECDDPNTCDGECIYHTCAGTLIHEKYILTAAHCVYGAHESQLTVQLGVLKIGRKTRGVVQTRKVDTMMVHPRYEQPNDGPTDRNHFEYDIAVLKLKIRAKLTRFVKVAELGEGEESFTGKECVIAGWGNTPEKGGDNVDLMEAVTSTISTEACQNLWPTYPISNELICVFVASLEPRKRPGGCQGDSGGPLMCGKGRDAKLVGVLKAGSQCRHETTKPDIYVNVARGSASRRWIRETTGV